MGVKKEKEKHVVVCVQDLSRQPRVISLQDVTQKRMSCVSSENTFPISKGLLRKVLRGSQKQTILCESIPSHFISIETIAGRGEERISLFGAGHYEEHLLAQVIIAPSQTQHPHIKLIHIPECKKRHIKFLVAHRQIE